MPGIYIHVPFCLRKCDYCDFYSLPVSHEEVPREDYLKAVLGQLKRDASLCGITDSGVSSVYFGGGTPSLMPARFFSEVLAEIGRRFILSPDAEVSCEVNPATADAAWFRDAREAGITRVSIGVQSFNDELLKFLGRVHSAADAMRAVAEAQDAGFRSVGFDLMYAIPGEDIAMLEDDLRTAMTFQPDHISAYQLTIEEGTPMAQQGVAVDDDDALDQMRAVGRMLSRSGWPRYEISNFAKPGFECRHNLNYWRYGEYLGLGAGAASFVRTGPGPGFARRWTQACDVSAYMKGDAALAESEDIDARTAMGEYCFLGLRTTEGISPAAFEGLFHASFGEVFGAVCESLEKDGLISRTADLIALTQRGIELSNMVFERFIS